MRTVQSKPKIPNQVNNFKHITYCKLTHSSNKSWFLADMF